MTRRWVASIVAISEDLQFLRLAHTAGCVRGSCLEVGSCNVAGTVAGEVRQLTCGWGLEYVGADAAAGPGVDLVVDFTSGPSLQQLAGRRWDTIVMFNVIEHVFDPITLLDNVTELLAPEGTLLISSPIVWELHRFPRDYWRPNPDFYEDYAERRGLALVRELFCFGLQNRLVPVSAYELPDGARRLPSLATAATTFGGLRAWTSRAVHRAFNTLGRNHPYTWTALACALRREARSTVLKPTRAQ